MGDDKAAAEHPLVDFVEQQLREPPRPREVFEMVGIDLRPAARKSFAPSQCRPGRRLSIG